MRKIIVWTLLLFFAIACFGQQTKPNQHWTESDFYKKSRKQKTAAWIFTGVGTAVLLVTLFSEAFTIAYTLGEGETSGTTLPYAIGGACVATGIVFFIAAGKNKKKAITSSAFIDIEKAPVITRSMTSNRSFPVVGLRISL